MNEQGSPHLRATENRYIKQIKDHIVYKNRIIILQNLCTRTRKKLYHHSICRSSSSCTACANEVQHGM